MSPVPELARPVPVERVGAGLVVQVEADAAECELIARRLQVPSVEAVRCRWVLRPASDGAMEAEGSLRASLYQDCVVSLEPFAVELVEEFAVRFVLPQQASEAADDPDEPDELPIEGGVLELGEATVEQLALALDPYPRRPGATLPGEASEPLANPFGALANWRRSE